ncbi:trichohyalin [Drosophila busckii]|uniref:trichohyalin n=1 Tax=Drosophila busckii TaxID=30019 RepID=UPI00083F086C|nr:trichohyalin [Drosophila busckii]
MNRYGYGSTNRQRGGFLEPQMPPFFNRYCPMPYNNYSQFKYNNYNNSCNYGPMGQTGHNHYCDPHMPPCQHSHGGWQPQTPQASVPKSTLASENQDVVTLIVANNNLKRMTVRHLDIMQQQSERLLAKEKEKEEQSEKIKTLFSQNQDLMQQIAELGQTIEDLHKQMRQSRKRPASEDDEERQRSTPKAKLSCHVETQTQWLEEPPQNQLQSHPPLKQKVLVTSVTELPPTTPAGRVVFNGGKKVSTLFLHRVNQETTSLQQLEEEPHAHEEQQEHGELQEHEEQQEHYEDGIHDGGDDNNEELELVITQDADSDVEEETEADEMQLRMEEEEAEEEAATDEPDEYLYHDALETQEMQVVEETVIGAEEELEIDDSYIVNNGHSFEEEVTVEQVDEDEGGVVISNLLWQDKASFTTDKLNQPECESESQQTNPIQEEDLLTNNVHHEEDSLTNNVHHEEDLLPNNVHHEVDLLPNNVHHEDEKVEQKPLNNKRGLAQTPYKLRLPRKSTRTDVRSKLHILKARNFRQLFSETEQITIANAPHEGPKLVLGDLLHDHHKIGLMRDLELMRRHNLQDDSQLALKARELEAERKRARELEIEERIKEQKQKLDNEKKQRMQESQEHEQLELQKECELQKKRERQKKRKLQKKRELKKNRELQKEIERQKELQNESELQKDCELHKEHDLQKERELHNESALQIENTLQEKRELEERELHKESEVQKERKLQKDSDLQNESELQKEPQLEKEPELEEREQQKESELQKERELQKESELEKEVELQKELEVEKESELQKEQAERELEKEPKLEKESELQKETEAQNDGEEQKQREQLELQRQKKESELHQERERERENPKQSEPLTPDPDIEETMRKLQEHLQKQQQKLQNCQQQPMVRLKKSTLHTRISSSGAPLIFPPIAPATLTPAASPTNAASPKPSSKLNSPAAATATTTINTTIQTPLTPQSISSVGSGSNSSSSSSSNHGNDNSSNGKSTSTSTSTILNNNNTDTFRYRSSYYNSPASQHELFRTSNFPYTTRSWEDQEIHCDNEFFLEEADELLVDDPELEIPEWRVVKYKPSTIDHKKESITDADFVRRHEKHVKDEIERKKRDARYLREQSRSEQLRSRHNQDVVLVQLDPLPTSTFYPLPEDIESLQYVTDVPVQAFGEDIVNMRDKAGYFVLPWLEAGQATTPEAKAKADALPVATLASKKLPLTAAEKSHQEMNSSYVFLKRRKRQQRR